MKNLKRTLGRALCGLALVLLAAGCADILQGAGAEKTGTVTFTIGNVERTVLPSVDQFAKITLSFTGTGGSPAVEEQDITAGSVTIRLPVGSWGVTAKAYLDATGSSPVATAQNSIGYNGTNVTGNTRFILIPTGTGAGTLKYSVTVPDGVALAGSGSQITVERNGAVLESLDEEGFTDGAHPISATETDQTVALEAGRYVVEIVLVNDNDDTAVYRESVILLSGLTTEIAFAPAAGGFLSASERAALTLVDELEFGVTAGNEGGIVVGELVTDGGGYTIAVTAPNGTGTVSFTLKKPEGHIVTVGGGDGGKVIASAGETLVVFAVDTSTVANTGGPIVFTLTVAEDGKISVDISVRVTVHAFPISSPDPSLTTNSAFLLKNDGTLWAVGYNRYGSFGNGTTIDTRPYTTDTFTQVANSVTAVANYASDTYIIKDDGSLWAAGRNNYNTHTSETSAFEKEFASGAKAVSVYNGILVLMENGDVYARGTNTNGQLGAGTVANVTEWTKVAEGVKQIAKGNIFSLILKNNGEVWGAGKHAALGIGTSGDVAEYASFQKVFENAAAIAVGASHSLILKNDGTLWGAGEAINGKLGNGNINQNPNFNPNVESFTQLKDSNERAISGVSAISGGSQHSLILKTDGSLWGTGFLNNFNCTDGSSELRVGYFTKMVDGGVTKISAQGPQSFIIKNDGTLWAAGNVGMGILGNTAATVCQDFTQITWPQ